MSKIDLSHCWAEIILCISILGLLLIIWNNSGKPRWHQKEYYPDGVTIKSEKWSDGTFYQYNFKGKITNMVEVP